MAVPERQINNVNTIRSLDVLQRVALGGMFVLILLTFIGAQVHTRLWQSSDWLVSTVLPSVVVNLTNVERADSNAAPLRRSATLDAAAKLKAEHMAQNEYFSHYAPDGTSPWFWFDQVGYTYAHAGENLAIHFSDSAEVVDAWMRSPTHKANIVASQYTEIGVGTAKGEYEGYDTVYVVQLFGTPARSEVPVTPPTPPVALVTSAPVAAAELTEEAETFVTEVLKTEEPAEAPAVLAASDGEDPIEPPVAANQEPAVDTVITIDSPLVASSSAAVTAPRLVEPVASPARKELPAFSSSMVATSSGLIALIEQATTTDAAPMAGIATKPNTLLQVVYGLFGVLVIGLLLSAAVLEARRERYLQVAYSVGLLLVMGGLWYLNAWLTTGAVIS